MTGLLALTKNRIIRAFQIRYVVEPKCCDWRPNRHETSIHPNTAKSFFQDSERLQIYHALDAAIRETIEMDGKTYPLFKLDTSSVAPFYTGAQTRIVEAVASKNSARSSRRKLKRSTRPPPRRPRPRLTQGAGDPNSSRTRQLRLPFLFLQLRLPFFVP